MKKHLYRIAAFSLGLTILLSGCSAPRETESDQSTQSSESKKIEPFVFGENGIKVLHGELSDSGSPVEWAVEFDTALKIYKDEKAPKTVEVSVEGIKYNCKYQESRKTFYNQGIVEYKSAGITVMLSADDHRLLGFYKDGYSEPGSILIDESGAADIARNFLAKFVGNIDEYRMQSCEYNTDHEFYIVAFAKYIGDCETEDAATLYIENDGTILMFTSTLLDQIPADLPIKVDIEGIKKAVIDRLEEEYGKITEYAGSRVDRIEYEDVTPILYKMGGNQ